MKQSVSFIILVNCYSTLAKVSGATSDRILSASISYGIQTHIYDQVLTVSSLAVQSVPVSELRLAALVQFVAVCSYGAVIGKIR